jgi:GNAT superfamily N-acetyltransferase
MRRRPGIRVRPAAKADAAAACDVIRRSITELLAGEHMNDEPTLAAWLENKSEENALRWISADDRYSIVALDDGRICGFGMIKTSGEVGLLYVAPEARFRGASKSMLRELERQASLWGVRRVTAVSSLTARDFYVKRRYVASGELVKGFGRTLGYPVSKTLASARYRKVSAG